MDVQALTDDSTKVIALGIGIDEFAIPTSNLNAIYAFPLNGPISMASVFALTLIPKRYDGRAVAQFIVRALDEVRRPHEQWLLENRDFGPVVTQLSVLIGDNKGVSPSVGEGIVGILGSRND